jgi:Family of unknown function (DUF6603)
VPGSPGTLEQLAKEVGSALAPLGALDASNVVAVLRDLGVQFPASLTADSGFMTAVSGAASSASTLATDTGALITAITGGDDDGILSAGVKVIDDVGATITTFDALSTALNAVPPSGGLTTAQIAAFAESLAENLLAYLFVGYLETARPTLAGILTLFGVIDRTVMPGVSADPTQPPFIARKLHLAKLIDLLQNPAQLLKDTVDWGDPAFNGAVLLQRMHDALDSLALPIRLVPPAPAPPTQLTTPLFTLAVDNTVSPPGLLLTLTVGTSAPVDVPLQLSPNWSLQITASAALAAGLTMQIRPPGTFALKPPTGTLTGQLLFDLHGPAAGASPILLFGETGKSRMEIATVDAGVGVSVTWDATNSAATGELLLKVGLTGGNVVIDMSEADGFLSAVTSGTPIQAGFEFACTWQPNSGLHVTGGAQLEIDLPLHLDLGPVDLETLYLVGGLANDAVTLEVSAGIGVTLGPIAASVDRVGLLGTLTFPAHGGNLGPANLALGFKPPNGLGLSIDAGVISGGGYISFDVSQGRYSGVISLSLLDTIGITVITVLETVLPDGSSGFSLLFIITFTLPPIQLGFGFTLTAVGGLGGVNRSMNTSALQAGFRAHTLDSIMFPSDPIANAPQIISDIRNFFPAAEGRYLFGPLLQISWGTPTLISLSIGAILEVPDPIVLALIGLVDAALPDEDAALISLHIEVLGILDFGAQTLSIDGSLYNSYVLIFSIGGDMCFRLAWGNDPNFVFSFGGFNPQFNADGLNVPQMARLSISIGDGDNPRISADSYYAVTSNSIQFGANVQAYASAAGFSISGYLGFDVLFIISPFSFEFDFQAGFDVSFEGASLLGLNVDGLFSGPTPWHFHGDASISFLFFTVSASIDLTWGDSNQVTIPAKPVLPDLLAALDNPSDWSAALPPSASAGVSFLTPKPTDTTLRVHPIGTLTVREKVVPLDLAITRYGNATPSDGDEFSIQSVQINGQGEGLQPIHDYFSAGQFLTLSDGDKLSKPSFEKYAAGVTIGSTAVTSGEDRARTVTYEEYYIDEPTSFARFTRLYQMPAAIHQALSAQGAGCTSPLMNTGMSKYGAELQATAINITEPPYVVANVADLSIRSDIASAGGTTYYQAQQLVQSYLTANPGETGNLQIVPLYEAAA